YDPETDELVDLASGRDAPAGEVTYGGESLSGRLLTFFAQGTQGGAQPQIGWALLPEESPWSRGLRGPRSGRGRGLHRRGDRYLRCIGEHDPEDFLERQQVDATAPRLEVVACAAPLTGVEAHVMGVVVTAEREGQAIDRDPIELACVAIRLLDLT